MRPYLLALVAGFMAALPASAAEQRNPDDAALRAVQFLDADVGYAVGDEGVIWKTINGGKTWELLPSDVRSSLRSIHMLTHLDGWVVGREELPYGSGSAGVVLYTRDGGETWKRILSDAVPGLNMIRFGDGNTAYLAGDGSDQYPTGVFVSNDAGGKWRPVKGPRCTTWLGGDFLDGQTGSLAGAWSQLGALREGNFGKADVDRFEGRNILGMQLRATKSFAVGQGGLVLQSESQGKGWGPAATKLSDELLATWDFHAVSCVGDKVWIVGRPGSAVLSSEDKGKNWQISKTGQNLPLHAVHFFDEKRGWAVGEFGTILATSDGGKTWAVQHRGGQRAAVLCVHARAEDLPADTIAMLGGDHGLLTAAIRVAGPDPKSASFADAAQGARFAAAHRSAGGGAGEMLWQFPVPQDYFNADKTTLFKFWDQLQGNRAGREMLRQLVLAIRMWQPELVLTDHPDAKVTGCAASALVAEALHEAFAMAADAEVFPEQIEQLGLKAWRVSKVYGLWDKRDGSHVAIDNNREAAPLQATYAEFAATAARLLEASPNVPAQRFYRLLDSAKAGNHKDLLDGIEFGEVGVCRRPLAALEELDPKLIAAVKSQRQLVNLAKNPGNGLAEAPQLLGQLGVMLAKLPEDRAAKAVHIIANEFARQGQWELARATFLEMVERYPLHPLSVDAYRWLIRHNTSSEARRRQELGQFLIAPQAPGKGMIAPATLKDPKAPGGEKPAAIVQQGAFLGDPGVLQHWNQGSLVLGKRLAGLGSLYANDPSTQFCLQSANRRLGKFKEAQEYFSAFCAECGEGPWRDIALQELWFVNRTTLPPRPIAYCRFTAAKPYLDGKFDEDCWQKQKPMSFKNAIHDTTKDYPTEAMLSFDAKYLYVALKCKHPAGQGLAPAKERPRDADLRAFDRVSIMLDLDRDYSTFFRLEVDQRGCACEDCWGDKKWNPQWHVAIRSDDTGWQVEAAIPLHDLTGDRVLSGAAWACNIVRILPGRGVQAWSTPAGVEPRPEGMGLMLFQGEK